MKKNIQLLSPALVFICLVSFIGFMPGYSQENNRHSPIRETVWQPVDPGGHGWLTCGYVHPMTGHMFYSSDMGDSLLRSTDQGETWEPIANPIVGTAYSIVGDPKEPYTLYINQIGDMPKPSGTYDFGGGPKSWGIWKSTDNGDTWVQICNTDVFGKHISQSGVIDPDNNKVIYWTAADGGIQKSVDGGHSWREISTGLDKGNIKRYWHLNGIELDHTSPSENRRIYYPTSLGLYYMDEPDRKWNLMEGGLPSGSCNDVEACDGGIVYAVINDKGLYKSKDGGKTWNLLENGLETIIFTMLCLTPGLTMLFLLTRRHRHKLKGIGFM